MKLYQNADNGTIWVSPLAQGRGLKHAMGVTCR